MDFKKSHFLNPDRRQLLATAMSLAGSGLTKNLPISPRQLVRIFNDPEQGMIALLGLNDAITDEATAELSVARMLPTQPPSSDFEREMNEAMFAHVPRDVLRRAEQIPVDQRESLAFITKWISAVNWTNTSHVALGITGERNDEADWNALCKLSGTNGDANSLLRAQSLDFGKAVDFFGRVRGTLSKYRIYYDMQRGLEEEARMDSKRFRDTISSLIQKYPHNFGKPGSSLSLENCWRILERARTKPRDLIAPDMLEERVMEGFSRLIGYIPDQISPQVQARLKKIIEADDYKPYLSEEAEMERAAVRMEEKIPQSTVSVAKDMEEVPYFLPHTNGNYREPDGSNSLPVYRVSISPAEYMGDLATLINEYYPFDPTVSDTLSYRARPRVIANGTLEVVSPPPELVDWLQSLTNPKTRITAIERLVAMEKPGPAIA